MGNEVDYCKDCGCPLDICCKKLGAIEELEELLKLINDKDKFGLILIRQQIERIIKDRIKELKK